MFWFDCSSKKCKVLGESGCGLVSSCKIAMHLNSAFGWVLPPLSSSGIISTIWLYIALNRTPNIDCYWVGAVPKLLVCLQTAAHKSLMFVQLTTCKRPLVKFAPVSQHDKAQFRDWKNHAKVSLGL